jgi:hypothetical protein
MRRIEKYDFQVSALKRGLIFVCGGFIECVSDCSAIMKLIITFSKNYIIDY